MVLLSKHHLLSRQQVSVVSHLRTSVQGEVALGDGKQLISSADISTGGGLVVGILPLRIRLLFLKAEGLLGELLHGDLAIGRL